MNGVGRTVFADSADSVEDVCNPETEGLLKAASNDGDMAPCSSTPSPWLLRWTSCTFWLKASAVCSVGVPDEEFEDVSLLGS